MALKTRGSDTCDVTPGTQKAISHNLGVAPNAVLLTPTGNGTLYMTSMGSVSFSVASSLSNMPFNWEAVIDHTIIK